MANRINLNGTSYHGAGAIAEIANEAKAHAFKKAFVCSDPDLIKLLQSVVVHLWILQKQSVSSSQIQSLKM